MTIAAFGAGAVATYVYLTYITRTNVAAMTRTYAGENYQTIPRSDVTPFYQLQGFTPRAFEGNYIPSNKGYW